MLSNETNQFQEEVEMESLLRTQFTGVFSEQLQEYVIPILINNNVSHSFSYQPKFVREPFPVEGHILIWKDKTYATLALQNDKLRMESNFSFWFPEVEQEKPYLLYQDCSEPLQKNWQCCSQDSDIFIPNHGYHKISIPENKRMKLKKENWDWVLYETNPEEEQEDRMVEKFKSVDQRIYYIDNAGTLTIEGDAQVKGGVVNRGLLEINGLLSLEGVWWELGTTTGQPKVKGKVLLSGDQFSGEGEYDFLSLRRHGRYLKVLYHIEPKNFKIYPYNYFKN